MRDTDMKKYIALAAAALLSSCACFEGEEEVYVPEQKTCTRGDASCHKARENRYTRNYEVKNYDEDVYYRRPRRSSYRILTADDINARPQYRQVQVNTVPQTKVIQVVERPVPAPQPAPVIEAPVKTEKCNSCEPTIRETREPVEILYKKTTYKTVYEPKTTEEVSYEKVPYNQVKTDTVVKEVVTTTTTTSSDNAPVVMTVEERK